MNFRRFVLLLHFAFMFFLILSCADSPTNSNENPNEDPDGDPSFSYSHERNPGDSAIDFLTDDDFENLVVEIDYMQGYEPTSEALSSLESFLEERLNKSSVTIQSPTSVPAGGQSNYSANDVRDLEDEYRSAYSEENTLTAYIIILDGEYSNSNVLGIAYYNTSMALFGETIQSVSDGVGQNPQNVVEATVLRHEFGHNLGLVNNGVDMQQNHQDNDHGSHCDNESCLMYYSVRTTDFFAVLLGGDIPELDQNCIADLQAAGGN